PSFHIRSTIGISVLSHQVKSRFSKATYSFKRLFISVHPAGLKAVAITDHPPGLSSCRSWTASGSVPQGFPPGQRGLLLCSTRPARVDRPSSALLVSRKNLHVFLVFP